MNTTAFRTRTTALFLVVLAGVLLSGCSRFSEEIRDSDAGMNGSFEVTESGLPVNWLLYSPKTVPTGDFDLVLDTTEYKEGSQSLKFVVRECSPAGGRLSPGFAQEFEAAPGETYRVSFWVKNDGSEFVVGVSGVSAQEGEDVTIVQSQEAIDTWQEFEYVYTIPEKMNALRFEMNILQPGTFWIDDIRIERLDDKSG